MHSLANFHSIVDLRRQMYHFTLIDDKYIDRNDDRRSRDQITSDHEKTCEGLLSASAEIQQLSKCQIWSGADRKIYRLMCYASHVSGQQTLGYTQSTATENTQNFCFIHKSCRHQADVWEPLKADLYSCVGSSHCSSLCHCTVLWHRQAFTMVETWIVFMFCWFLSHPRQVSGTMKCTLSYLIPSMIPKRTFLFHRCGELQQYLLLW